MGRIVLIDVKIAEAADNPYNLSMGTQYSICYVTCLKPDDIKKNNGINLLKRLCWMVFSWYDDSDVDGGDDDDDYDSDDGDDDDNDDDDDDHDALMYLW